MLSEDKLSVPSVSSASGHGVKTDAYRLFFPLGVLMGVAGVSIWPLYYFGVLSGYSGRSHMFVQADCFLYCFIVGFLWTAIPRFSGTTAPSRKTQYIEAGLLILAAACFEIQIFQLGHLLFLAAHIVCLAVLARRFLRRQSMPPPTFILIGVGMISGMIGALLNAGVAWQKIDLSWDLAGRRLLTEGMVLLLVLGIGSFLGPRLLGFAQLPDLQSIGKVATQTDRRVAVTKPNVYGVAGAIIVATILLEYGYGLPLMSWLRALIATSLVVASISPWRLPVTRTTLAWCVWTAYWLLIGSLWIVAAVPRYRIDFLHVMFMGAFTLLIMSVGTRVVLSHGGHSLMEERKSWPLRIGLTTGMIALLARLAAPFVPNSYFSHLAWAGLLWISGLISWGVYAIRRIRT